MENNSRLKLIAEDVDAIKGLIRKFQESPLQVPLIEVDLALEKLRRIYEHLVQIDVQGTVISTQIKEEIKVQKEIVNDEPIKEAPVELNLKKEDVIDSAPVEETEEKGKPSPKEIKGKEPPQALIDLFSATAVRQNEGGTKSLVDKMTEQKPPEIIADKFGKKKIAGLNQAIGINEKFFFINELFEGNMKDYKSAIDALDQSENLANAFENIEALNKKHGWDKSNEAYAMLIDFVERKFS